MKQAVLYGPNDLRVEETELPSLDPGDVLLKVDAALLCGTDVRIYTGRKTKNVTLPSVLGHEFAGHIVDHNGDLPDDLEDGDQACIYPLAPCGKCSACTKGHPNICRHRIAFGYQLPGGLAEYVKIPAYARENIVKLDEVSPQEAAIVEPISCALNGQNLAEVKGSDTVLVVGCGPLGLIHIRLAKAQGVKQVIAVEPNEARHEIAKSSGADLVLRPSEDCAQKILDASVNGGVDVLIVAIGRKDAVTPYLGILAPGARVSVFAGFNVGDMLEFTANDIHYNEWKIVGASSCRLENFRTIAPMINSGRLYVKDLIGTQLPIDDVVHALDLAASGADMRVGINSWA